MTFELMLPEERVKPHQVTALHLMAALAMIGTGAVIRLFYPVATWSLVLAGAGVLVLILSLFRNKWITAVRVNFAFRIAELSIMGGLAIFFAIKHWTPPAVMFGVLAAAILFSIFWERSSSQVQIIRIDEQGIKLPITSRKRSLNWPEVERVILRFGTLTIDCEDNRLYQWNITNADIDNEIFEAFCFAHIEAGRKKRIADW